MGTDVQVDRQTGLDHRRSRRIRGSNFAGFLVLLLIISLRASAADAPPRTTEPTAGLVYTNHQVGEVPWSIHVVKIDRADKRFGISAPHAGTGALGMSTLKDQIAALAPAVGKPVAAINGGFYQRDQVYAGCPRGLQIVEGELVSGPTGGATFWIDLLGEPYLTNVTSLFQITWPDGRLTPFELNGPRADDGVGLYTAAIGPTTRTRDGRELLLEPLGKPWLSLRLNRMYSARVREVREAGNTTVPAGALVLSLGSGVMKAFEDVRPGAILGISTASSPRVIGARTALSGGPILVSKGKRQRIRSAPDAPYELSSMLERHPRTAFGWNEKCYFFVQVDGRQRDLSVGMTLQELSAYLVRLGCEEALNLDGGGSSSLWFDGEVRNNPCDGYDRPIANSLVVVLRETRHGAGETTGHGRAATKSAE